MSRLIHALFAIALLLPGLARGTELIDRIVVVVNDDLVLESEVQDEIRSYLEMEPDALPIGPERDAAMAELREIVIEGLVGRKLMDQAVIRLGITVEEMEIQAQLGETARMNSMSVDQLKAQLARQGIPLEEFLTDLREQLKQFKLFQAEIGTKVDITEDQLRQRFNERHADMPDDPELHLRVIVLRNADPANPKAAEEVRQRAADIRAQLDAGASFEQLARQYSEDPGSAERGGNFGTVRVNSLIPELRAAVEGLTLNEVSDPVELNSALWLLQIYRITNAAAVTFEEVRDQLFSELYQEEEERQIELWIEREKVRSHIERLH